MSGDASLTRLYREFGDRWEIEPIPPGSKWIAVQRDSGGAYVVMVAAHDVHALRFRMNATEHDEPEERESGQPGSAR